MEIGLPYLRIIYGAVTPASKHSQNSANFTCSGFHSPSQIIKCLSSSSGGGDFRITFHLTTFIMKNEHSAVRLFFCMESYPSLRNTYVSTAPFEGYVRSEVEIQVDWWLLRSWVYFSEENDQSQENACHANEVLFIILSALAVGLAGREHRYKKYIELKTRSN